MRPTWSQSGRLYKCRLLWVWHTKLFDRGWGSAVSEPDEWCYDSGKTLRFATASYRNPQLHCRSWPR